MLRLRSEQKKGTAVKRAYFRRSNIAKKFQRAVYQRPTTITCDYDRLNAPNGDYIGSVVIWTEKQK